jgi:hypothetical protein
MYVTLNLPAPSTTLINLISEYVNNTQLDIDNKRWLDEFHNNKINSVLHLFQEPPDLVKNQSIAEYQLFFPKHTITSTIGIMKNISGTIGCLPPHIDRKRALAINYYVDLGGDSVETVFYNLTLAIRGLAYNIPYDETGGVVAKEIFKSGWHAYDVNQCHSVENIETTRVLLTILLTGNSNGVDNEVAFNYSLDCLIKDYPELIKSQTHN